MNQPNTLSSISPAAALAPGILIGPFCVIHPDVVVSDGSQLGAGVILYPGTRLGRNVHIQDHAIIGKRPQSPHTATLGAQLTAAETYIEDEVFVGAGAVVYAGCRLRSKAFLGDGASLRENCTIGFGTTVGRSVVLEFEVQVGDSCLIFTGTYLSEKTHVEDEVFIGARVCTASGKVISFRRDLPCGVDGPMIRRGSRIGTGAVLHPGVEIGFEAVIAAGAVVFESVPPATLVLGNPARPVRHVAREEFLPHSPLLSRAEYAPD
jgi:UDP-2-acetamido-3-amino-2,3-dideoxy-glucuronate N-acetyltransferase